MLVYLVTALVPSETACLANSPGKRKRTAVWISRLAMVGRLLYWMGQTRRLSGDAFKDVVNQRVHDGHFLGREASVGVASTLCRCKWRKNWLSFPSSCHRLSIAMFFWAFHAFFAALPLTFGGISINSVD